MFLPVTRLLSLSFVVCFVATGKLYYWITNFSKFDFTIEYVVSCILLMWWNHTLLGEEVEELQNGQVPPDFNFDQPLPFSNSSWQSDTSVGDYHIRAKRAVNKSMTQSFNIHILAYKRINKTLLFLIFLYVLIFIIGYLHKLQFSNDRSGE